MSKPNELPESHNHEHDHNHKHEATYIHNLPGEGHGDDHQGHNHSALGGHVHATGTRLKWAFFATFFILASRSYRRKLGE